MAKGLEDYFCVVAKGLEDCFVQQEKRGVGGWDGGGRKLTKKTQTKTTPANYRCSY